MGLAVGGVEGRAVWWEKTSREKELRDRRLEGWVRSENYGSMAGGEFSGKRNGRGKSEGGAGFSPQLSLPGVLPPHPGHSSAPAP